jgi:hypothetical protein
VVKGTINGTSHRVKWPYRIKEDNQECLAIANNRRTDDRTKHIDVRYHHIRDNIEMKRINAEYCPTHQMLADILTKPVCG